MVAFWTFLFSSAPSSVGNPQLLCNNDNPQERIEYPQYKTEKSLVECETAKKEDDDSNSQVQLVDCRVKHVGVELGSKTA